MGRSISDNFKKRFGDPERIKIKFETGKLSPSDEAYRDEKTAAAYVDILRNLLGRKPTHEEIVGKVDISKKLLIAKRKVAKGKAI